MTQQKTQTPKRHLPQLDGWSLASGLIAVLVLAPIVSVVWIAFHPTENIWPHLLATVMPRYMAATLGMMLGVGLITAAVGTGAAWLVTLYRFPGSGWLTWALLFPLAVPAYVGAQVAQPAPVQSVSRPVVQPIPQKSAGMRLNDALGRLAKNPQDVAALIEAGKTSLELGDAQAAIGFFERALQLQPGNAGRHRRAG